MHRNPKYLVSLIPALLVISGNLAGGWWVGANALFSLGVLALLEWVAPEDRSNTYTSTDWLPDALLVTHVVAQLACMASLGWFVLEEKHSTEMLVLAVLSTGINTGASGIVIAHELIHRREPLMKFLGKVQLFTACNFYFFIDHVKGHHRWVGTPHDPATAPQGENVYAFFFRSALGQLRSSMRLEKERLLKSGKQPYSLHNYVIAASVLQAGVLVILQQWFGWDLVLAFLAQGLLANFLLEYTNYIEHYGLRRSGSERVNAGHSWQTDKVISRFFLIDLSRHADHHFHASRPYHRLESLEGSPVLPGGYVSLIYLALIPPLFFRVVDPVLHRFTQHNPEVS